MQEPRVYRHEALNKLEGRYGDVILYVIIVGVVNAVITTLTDNFRPVIKDGIMTDPGIPALVTLFSIIAFLVGAGIAFGSQSLFIDIVEKRDFNVWDKIKLGFVDNYGRNIILVFLRDLFIFLWMLLLIIPGFIKAYAYSMSVYIAIRKPNIDGLDAISESKTMMNGHKGELFFLDLSYIGWYLLSILTFGILLLWVYPRHSTARTLFFDEIYFSHYPSEGEIKVEDKEEDIFGEPLI